MKKQFRLLLLPVLLFLISGAALHKFHMALYQVNYASEKKMLQITSRIHIDDLNKAIEKKNKKKIAIGDPKQALEESLLVKEYLTTNFSIKVNDQITPMHFLSQEVDGDELVCYWNIKGISKIKSLEIANTVLIDVYDDQQNMVNVNVPAGKKSFILTKITRSKMLKY